MGRVYRECDQCQKIENFSKIQKESQIFRVQISKSEFNFELLVDFYKRFQHFWRKSIKLVEISPILKFEIFFFQWSLYGCSLSQIATMFFILNFMVQQTIRLSFLPPNCDKLCDHPHQRTSKNLSKITITKSK